MSYLLILDIILKKRFMNKIDSLHTNSASTFYLRSDEVQTKSVDSLVIKIEHDPIQFSNQNNATDNNASFSLWFFILFITVGIGIQFGVSMIKKYIIPFFKTRYNIESLQITWYRITLIIWLCFTLILSFQMLNINTSISLSLLLVIVIIAHQFLIDFFIGLFIKFEHQIKLNDKLILEDISGEVLKFNKRHLKVRTQSNEFILIPYRNLLSKPIVIAKKDEDLLSKILLIELEGPINENLNKLSQYMSKCPWIHNSKNYQVKHLSETTYEIHVFAKEVFTFLKIEEYINQKKELK